MNPSENVTTSEEKEERQAYSDQYGGVSTRNFNVDSTSESSATQDGVTTYGTTEQLSELGMTPDITRGVVSDVPGVAMSMAPSSPTSFMEQIGVQGKYSPTHIGGYGISAPDMGTGPEALSMIDMVAQNMIDPTGRQGIGSSLSVGSGLTRPEVVDISLTTGEVTGYKPPEYGLTDSTARLTPTQAKDLALATGKRYAGRVGAASEYVGYEVDEGFDIGTLENSRFDAVQTFLSNPVVSAFTGLPSLSGIASMVMGIPKVKKVQSLSTGETGTYIEPQGALAAIGIASPSVSFKEVGPPTFPEDSGLNTMIADVYEPAPKRTRSFSRFPSIKSSRFPSPFRAQAPSAPSPRLKATGGYIGSESRLNEGLKNKERGFHAFTSGNEIYAVEPDSRNPGKFITYNGDETQIKSIIGNAFGYDPTSIDLSKYPGETGFGTDLVPEDEPQKMAMGGVPVGFVGDTPDNVPNSQTVADDVPLDVPEGTFILNAPAVEEAGISDIKNMLLTAMKEAEKAGIDISANDSKISREDAVALLVSKGEVAVPPVLAKIIGYETLKKINNRGTREVERRQQESQEAPVDSQMRVMAAEGGVKTNIFDYMSVKEIDDQADILFTDMQQEIQNRVKQELDLSTDTESQISARAKITSDVLGSYHDKLRDLKENSDPYAFQQFQDRNTDKSITLMNALDFNENPNEFERRLAEQATYSTNIPLGSDNNTTLGANNDFVGIAFPYLEGGEKVAYVAGQDTERTTPASTARHETAHLQFQGRETLRPTKISVGDSEVYLNEEQMMRLLDINRATVEGDEGVRDRALDYLTSGNPRRDLKRRGLSSFLNLSTSVSKDEILENLPDIIRQIQEAQQF